MTEVTDEPATWQNFDNSPLPELLRYDTVPPNIAIPLLCNIDPTRSEIFSISLYFRLENRLFHAVINHSDDEIPDIEQICKEYPEYWRIRLLSDDPNNSPRCWFEKLAGVTDECEKWRREIALLIPPGLEKEYSATLDTSHQLRSGDAERITAQVEAQKKVERTWRIYFSNPNHQLDLREIESDAMAGRLSQIVNRELRDPSYYIDWAISKGLDIEWLQWACSRGYLAHQPKDSSTQVDVQATESNKVEESQERQKEIYELREKAIQEAVKLREMGLHKKYITVTRICEEIFGQQFASGKPISERWRTVEGMRGHLKGKHNPKNTEEFRNAKSRRQRFNK